MNKKTATFAGAARWLALSVVCIGVASCSSTTGEKKKARSKEYFAESEYGVKASPRVASGKNVPKGGGRYLVGKPYVVRGKTYVPKLNPDYEATGLASWYGSAFHGRKTANGEVYDQYHISAAHPTMPLPSYARVTNMENGSSVVVRVNDRGPFHQGRIIDVSEKTADLLDMKGTGTARVRVEYVGPARMDGHDMPFLMASYSPKGNRLPHVMPDGIGGPGIMVASASAQATSVVPVAAPTPSPAPQSTATAFATVSADSSNGDAFMQFILLPEIGPVPPERPDRSFALGDGTLSSAYASSEEPASALAFEAILVRDDRLTEAAIQAFAARRAPAGQR
ncbi:septal ring lytic transglycosylase RlpA family protein [Ciceribacter sp. L1K22]|uniref:septal ring lytic transglycosylase RlpA family protein n=1 Tax=Ciceribacter sp. L1K22 TaxID=2820275 RepID=UPI001ABEBB69|nr:septal ring lytic transglycosylase RlpA family protein [Ciceribacter sp. L1K22]MBO3760334.1 septal ring lytic transglycosylase RlpA family protein [Ciceribacter sp. L1K22]